METTTDLSFLIKAVSHMSSFLGYLTHILWLVVRATEIYLSTILVSNYAYYKWDFQCCCCSNRQTTHWGDMATNRTIYPVWQLLSSSLSTSLFRYTPDTGCSVYTSHLYSCQSPGPSGSCLGILPLLCPPPLLPYKSQCCLRDIAQGHLLNMNFLSSSFSAVLTW